MRVATGALCSAMLTASLLALAVAGAVGCRASRPAVAVGWDAMAGPVDCRGYNGEPMACPSEAGADVFDFFAKETGKWK